jgi:hypothetical protein
MEGNMLNSPAITELTSESAALNLLAEWLGDWFNGQPQTVGDNPPMVFPKANLAFGQGPAVQPMWNFEQGVSAEIRTVMLPRSELQEALNTSLSQGWLVTSSVLLNFWVSAKHPGAGKSDQAAQQIAELLKAILTNPGSRFDLVSKGFRALRPREPQVVPSTDWAKRLVVCAAQLQYPVQFDVMNQ